MVMNDGAPPVSDARAYQPVAADCPVIGMWSVRLIRPYEHAPAGVGAESLSGTDGPPL